MSLNKIRAQEDLLVAMLKGKNQQALTLAYHNYSGAIYGIILRMLQSEEIAQEVLQDVFLKAWDNIEQYDATKGKFFTWLSTIARRLAIDKTRSAEYKKTEKTKNIEHIVHSEDRWSETPQFKDAGLERVISTMDEKYRTLIDMAYFYGYTHQEIHEATNIPIGTIKTRLRAAVQELRRLLGDTEVFSLLFFFMFN